MDVSTRQTALDHVLTATKPHSLDACEKALKPVLPRSASQEAKMLLSLGGAPKMITERDAERKVVLFSVG